MSRRLANANKRAKVIQALKRAGYRMEPGGRHTLVIDARGNCVSAIPNHRELNPTTLGAVLKQIGLNVDDFLDLY